jgi:hypothetical protein
MSAIGASVAGASVTTGASVTAGSSVIAGASVAGELQATNVKDAITIRLSVLKIRLFFIIFFSLNG